MRKFFQSPGYAHWGVGKIRERGGLDAAFRVEQKRSYSIFRKIAFLGSVWAKNRKFHPCIPAWSQKCQISIWILLVEWMRGEKRVGVPVFDFSQFGVFLGFWVRHSSGEKSKSGVWAGGPPGVGFWKSRNFFECLSSRDLGEANPVVRFPKSRTGTENANFKVPESGGGAWGDPKPVAHISGVGGPMEMAQKIGTKIRIAESETS